MALRVSEIVNMNVEVTCDKEIRKEELIQI